MNIYDFILKDAKGNDIDFSIYKGKVLLIVNTATGCGFTPQYEGLEVLDFPCNQFGNQAPGSNDEIVEFCTGRFGVTFKVFSKIDVNGENESPLYTFLKGAKGGLLSSKIKWNFTKFLVDKQGNVVERFAPTITPDQIENKIKELL